LIQDNSNGGIEVDVIEFSRPCRKYGLFRWDVPFDLDEYPSGAEESSDVEQQLDHLLSADIDPS
jgi:hypothetical protein